MSTFLRVAYGLALFGAGSCFAALSPVRAENFKEVTLKGFEKANSPQWSKSLRTGISGQSYAPEPLQVFISLNNQRMRVYKGTRLINSTKISSGKKGHETPRGIFSIIEKKKYHESNLYANAPMPFMQRLTWSGIALHQGRVPNYPASHGCIRMPRKFASSVFKMSEYRDHVIIAPESVTPRAVDHPALFQPYVDLQASFSLRGTVENVDYNFTSGAVSKTEPLRMYITRTNSKKLVTSAQTMMTALGYYYGKANGRLNKTTIKALKHFQSQNELKKTGIADKETLAVLAEKSGLNAPTHARLHVRQNHKPLFSAPVKLKNPTRPMGSHLLLAYNFNQSSTKWSGATISTRIPKSIRYAHGLDETAKRRVHGDLYSVLDRLTLEKDTREKVSRLLTPGSSLAISDNGISGDTGKGTDFIVRTH